MKIDLKGAFRAAIIAVGLTLAFMILAVISVIIGGVLINAVTGGSITLSSGFNTVLNSLDTTTSAWFTTLVLVGTTLVGLVIVVVIVILFRKYVQMGQGGVKNGGNAY